MNLPKDSSQFHCGEHVNGQLDTKDRQLAAKDHQLDTKDQQLAAKDRQIGELHVLMLQPQLPPALESEAQVKGGRKWWHVWKW